MDKSSDLLRLFIESAIRDGRTYKSDLCAKAEIHRSNLDQILNKNSSPTLEILDRIAKALGEPGWKLIKPLGDEEASLTALQRDMIKLVKGMSDRDLHFFHVMLKNYPGNMSGVNDKDKPGNGDR